MTTSNLKAVCLTKFAAALSATALLLSGCSGNSPLTSPAISVSPDTETEESSSVVLNEWNQWSGTPNHALGLNLQKALCEFEMQHPDISVVDHGMEGNTYKTKIETDFTTTAGDIDVFFYWAPGRARQLLKADALLPLDSYVTDETLRDILPGMADNFIIDGKLYALPTSSSSMVLFCNKKLFDRCHLALPETWEDLKACAPVLRSAGFTPLSIGAADSWVAAGFFESLMTQITGADAMRELFQTGKYSGVNSKDPGGFSFATLKKASEEIGNFRQAGLFAEDIANCTWGDALKQFEDGKAAMLFDGTWSITELRASDFNLADLQIILVPTEDGLPRDLVGGASDSFFVNSHTRHPKEAAELAIALSRNIGESAMINGTGLSAWASALPADDPELTRIYDSIQQTLGGVKQIPAWNTLEGTSDFITRHQSFAQTLLSRDCAEEEIREIYG